MRFGSSLFSTAVLAVSLTFFALSAEADTFATYGDATVVSNGLLLTSNDVPGSGAAGYAGVYTEPSGTLTLNTLTQLSTDYEMTQGTFGGGAPRFSIEDTTVNQGEIYAYFGTPGAGGAFTDPNFGNTGALANTGNYADASSSDLRFQINGFGGVNDGYTFLTYQQVLDQVGNVAIGFISIDEDAGFSQPGNIQAIVVNNFTVNSDVFVTPSAVPEPTSIVLAISAVPFGLVMWLRRRKRDVA